MRRAWLAAALTTVVAACGVATPLHVQQRPFGLPFPIGLGAFPRPVLPPWLRPPVTVPSAAPPAAPVGAPGGTGAKPPPPGLAGGQQPPVQQPPAQQPPIQQPPVQGGAAPQPVQGQLQPVAQQPPAQAPVQAPAAPQGPKPLLALVPKGNPTIAAPSGVAGPTGIPPITRATLQLMPDKSLVLVLPDGSRLSAPYREGPNRISFTIQPQGGGTIAGILTMLVGEPYTVAYVVTDTGGRVFTVREEYTRS